MRVVIRETKAVKFENGEYDIAGAQGSELGVMESSLAIVRAILRENLGAGLGELRGIGQSLRKPEMCSGSFNNPSMKLLVIRDAGSIINHLLRSALRL